MDRKIRYAVVGLGNIAQVAVLPAFEHASESSELVGLVSSDPKKLRTLSERYRISVTGSYDELERVVRDGKIDAVYIAVPNSLHREMTERAARASAHVLCEKPMATTVADCEAMIRACDDANVKLMIAYRLHFEGANLEAIERIQRGDIGEPRVFSSVFSHQVRDGDIRTRAEMGGGALFDLGTYCINAARYVFRDEPQSVVAMQAVGTEERFRHVDEVTTAILRFSGDRIAQFVATQGAAHVSEFRVVGTEGSIELDPAFSYAEAVEGELRKEDETEPVRGERKDQFAPELVHFSQCILDDETPEPSGREGLADVRVMDAIIRAAATRAVVDLPPFERETRPGERLEMRKPPVKKPKTIHAPAPSSK